MGKTWLPCSSTPVCIYVDIPSNLIPLFNSNPIYVQDYCRKCFGRPKQGIQNQLGRYMQHVIVFYTFEIFLVSFAFKIFWYCFQSKKKRNTCMLYECYEYSLTTYFYSPCSLLKSCMHLLFLP